MKFSIVIPCFNELKNIKFLINDIKKNFRLRPFEFIFVNNGSKDNTKNFINNFKKKNKKISKIRFIEIKINRGYGYGVLKGLQSTKGDIVGWIHADRSIELNSLIYASKFFKVNESKNIFFKGIRVGERPFFDKVFSLFLSITSSIILRRILLSITSQPTLFHKSFLKTWYNPPNDFSLDLFSLYKAKISSKKIIRFKILHKDRLMGNSSWNKNFFSKIKLSFIYIKSIIKIIKLN
jgi:glycosyltransferase involved in cell wall biosynthesis